MIAIAVIMIIITIIITPMSSTTPMPLWLLWVSIILLVEYFLNEFFSGFYSIRISSYPKRFLMGSFGAILEDDNLGSRPFF